MQDELQIAHFESLNLNVSAPQTTEGTMQAGSDVPPKEPQSKEPVGVDSMERPEEMCNEVAACQKAKSSTKMISPVEWVK